MQTSRPTSPRAADVGDVLRRSAAGTSELLPRPPVRFTDEAGRAVELRVPEAVSESLVGMYVGYDPGDRTQGLPPRTEAQVRDWLDHLFASGYDVVADHGGTVVGHATLVPTEGGAELAIFVGSDHQGAGIGSRLLRTLLGHGRANGVERVWLTVARENYPAISLYRATGFRTVERGMELEMARRL
ncbi:MAG: N-acetyltransferase family protein [Haloarculaceae archaeon]